MKKLFSIFIMLSLSLSACLAQQGPSSQGRMHTAGNPPPQAVVEAFKKEISHNLRYPEVCEKYGAEARVVIALTVKENGEIENTETVNVEILNVKSNLYKRASEEYQEKARHAFCVCFAHNAHETINSISQETWKAMNNGRGNIRFSVPVTFKMK